ncbi:enoyl-CoA hydratase family protein [Dactylosporangium fulvum]|uniref:Enoyl-CoA hydratase-related protein n=1 Tax=Dactylosporangium fulvum TaxID=53359 RepID=A0ABY5VQ03_9ACTN|nr:enoyl-CoA hydratase-related protein [Dactylosporangium fulvum]UWP79848.1 enoyl-CoA hydratase-related protein [Dactylosporangium fulvum]
MTAVEDVTQQVRCTIADGVARIVLSRPEKLNALGPPQRERLISLLDQAGSSVQVRAVVLSAVGRAFCAGGDLSLPRRDPDVDGRPARVVGETGPAVRSAQALIAAVLDCPKPVIAAVNGVAAGMGAQLALAADFVVASTGARFAELFITRGIVPDAGAAYLLPRILGLHLAKRLLLLGGDLSVMDAERLGIVHQVVEPEELETTADALATRLAAGPTVAIGLAKRLLNQSLDSDRVAAFDREEMAVAMNVWTEDSAEGLRSFAEKRDPVFRGW